MATIESEAGSVSVTNTDTGEGYVVHLQYFYNPQIV